MFKNCLSEEKPPLLYPHSHRPRVILGRRLHLPVRHRSTSGKLEKKKKVKKRGKHIEAVPVKKKPLPSFLISL